MPVVVEPGVVREYVEGGIRALENMLRNVPPGAPVVVPLTVAGGAVAAGAVVVVGAVAVGTIAVKTPEFVRWLTSDMPTAGDEIRARLAEMIRLYRAEVARLGTVQAGGAVGLTLVPSPAQIQTQRLDRLADTVARQELWRRGHHRLVHEDLTRVEGRRAGAEVGLAVATRVTVATTVQAIREVIQVILPETVRQLTTTIRELRRAQQEANARLQGDLVATARDLVHRIGDVVTWLRTEALPDLARQIRAERETRREADARLRVGLAEEVSTRTDADLSIMTAVAPAMAFAAGIGAHTAEKVRRNEGVLDSLGSLDMSAWLALASLPALAALVTKLLARTLPHVSDVVGGLEEAAFRVLGEI